MRYRTKSDLTGSKLRSAITNGSSVLADVDHRSAWMRRLRDLIVYQTDDLGGDDAISEGERMLVRRAAMIALQLEMMETRFAEKNGAASPRQLVSYGRATNTLRRCLETLGLSMRQRAPSELTKSEILDRLRKRGITIDGEMAMETLRRARLEAPGSQTKEQIP